MLDLGPQLGGQRGPRVGGTREDRRCDRRFDLDAVEREHLKRVIRPHHVGVEQEPPEGRAALRFLVGDVERIAVRASGARVAGLERPEADQRANEIRLRRLVDVDVAEDQHAAGVEQLTQALRGVGVGERRDRVESRDLGPERRSEVPQLELSHVDASVGRATVHDDATSIRLVV